MTYEKKGQYDQAISDYNKALEIDPTDARVYCERGWTYYLKKEYDKSWKDINKAQELGYQIPPKYLDDLRKASGRQN
jgi:tetratricopeptide (TPR) repeat protein